MVAWLRGGRNLAAHKGWKESAFLSNQTRIEAIQNKAKQGIVWLGRFHIRILYCTVVLNAQGESGLTKRRTRDPPPILNHVRYLHEQYNLAGASSVCFPDA